MDENQSRPDPTQAPAPSRANHLASWLRYYAELLRLSGIGAWLIAGLVLIAWINSGVFKVQPDEEGVVLRFGRYMETVEPGLHYHLPFPIESVVLPKTTQVNQLHIGIAKTPGNVTVNLDQSHESQMLTGDENIVEAECTVFWKIKDPRDFLFKVRDPEASVRITAESALREIIGRTPIQSAMSDKRQQITDETRDLMQTLMDRENTGVLVLQVQLQRVDPPAEVIDAFNDVQRAKADQERARNDAESYANDVLPRARGEASRITQDAEAYKLQTLRLAEGDAKSFLSVYDSYQKSKTVTAWRLYLESIDEVLRKSAKVIVDTSGKGASAVVPYLPLADKDKAAAKELAK